MRVYKGVYKGYNMIGPHLLFAPRRRFDADLELPVALLVHAGHLRAQFELHALLFQDRAHGWTGRKGGEGAR